MSRRTQPKTRGTQKTHAKAHAYQKRLTGNKRSFMFFSDLEGNANENRFRYGNTTNLNYLNDLQRNHPPATTQYVFGGDAWDFGHSDPTRAKRALSSLYAIQHLQQLNTWHVLGNRDLNKLFIPFWLILLHDPKRVTQPNYFAGIWDPHYTPLSAPPATLRDAIDHILQKMQGVGPIFKGFDNYDGQMPAYAPTTSKPSALYDFIVDLYDAHQPHDAQARLFLQHLMCDGGVMYKWIQTGHIVMDMQWTPKTKLIVAHGSLPTAHTMLYYERMHKRGFREYQKAVMKSFVSQTEASAWCAQLMDTTYRYRNEKHNKTKVNALVQLATLSISTADSPVNASCIGDAKGIQQNVTAFRKRNHVGKDISCVVLHGHRNYSIDTPLKYTVNAKNTVLFYDTSSWRIHSNKHPTSLWGKRPSTALYVESASLNKTVPFADYRTDFAPRENTLVVNGVEYKRKSTFGSFVQGR